MTTSTENLIAVKKAEIRKIEADIRRLKAEIQILESLPHNDICLDLPLGEFEDLPMYIVESLRRHGRITTVNDLIHKSEHDLLKLRSIGPAKFQMIQDWLKKHNLKLLKED